MYSNILIKNYSEFQSTKYFVKKRIGNLKEILAFYISKYIYIILITVINTPLFAQVNNYKLYQNSKIVKCKWISIKKKKKIHNNNNNYRKNECWTIIVNILLLLNYYVHLHTYFMSLVYWLVYRVKKFFYNIFGKLDNVHQKDLQNLNRKVYYSRL